MTDIKVKVDLGAKAIVQATCTASGKKITIYDVMYGRALQRSDGKYFFVHFLPEYQDLLANSVILKAIDLFLDLNNAAPSGDIEKNIRKTATNYHIDPKILKKAIITYELITEDIQ